MILEKDEIKQFTCRYESPITFLSVLLLLVITTTRIKLGYQEKGGYIEIFNCKIYRGYSIDLKNLKKSSLPLLHIVNPNSCSVMYISPLPLASKSFKCLLQRF